VSKLKFIQFRVFTRLPHVDKLNLRTT